MIERIETPWIKWLREPAHERFALAWLQERIPHLDNLGIGDATYAAIAGGKSALGAVVAFHDWNQRGGTLQISMAADSLVWAKKENITALLRYPFEVVGVNKIWTGTPSTNERALRVNEKIGLERQAEVPDQFEPGVGVVFHGMTRAQWLASRWSDDDGETQVSVAA